MATTKFFNEKNTIQWKSLQEALNDEAFGARELKLFIENDSEIYFTRVKPIMKNLARKMVKDIYHPDKAIKLWMYLVDEAAKKYVKELGAPNEKWSNVFSKQERWVVAKQLSEEFEKAIKNGEFELDDLADYKPSKKLDETPSADLDMKKISPLETIRMTVGLSYRELLEDLITEMDDETYKKVINSLKKKYGYK